MLVRDLPPDSCVVLESITIKPLFCAMVTDGNNVSKRSIALHLATMLRALLRFGECKKAFVTIAWSIFLYITLECAILLRFLCMGSCVYRSSNTVPDFSW